MDVGRGRWWGMGVRDQLVQPGGRLGRGTTPSTSRPLPRPYRRDVCRLPLLVILAVCGCVCVCRVEKQRVRVSKKRARWTGEGLIEAMRSFAFPLATFYVHHTRNPITSHTT